MVVAADPANRIDYWDQRLATQPASGQLVAMFWTFDREANADLPIHICWGTPYGP